MDEGEMGQKEDASKEGTVDGKDRQEKTEESEVVKQSSHGSSSVALESESSNHASGPKIHNQCSDGRPHDQRRPSDNTLEEHVLHEQQVPLNVSDTLEEHNHIDDDDDDAAHIDRNVIQATQNYQYSFSPLSVDQVESDGSVDWKTSEGLGQISSEDSKALHHGKIQGQTNISIHEREAGNHISEEHIHGHSPADTSGSSLINMSTEKSPPKPLPLPPSGPYYPLSTFLKKMQLLLRCGTALFSLIAFAVMLSASETRVASGSTFHVKFSDFEAYDYLIALNMISFLYSIGQVIISFRLQHSTLSSPIRKAASIYICDQILAFLLVSCSSSGATASGLSHNGLHNIWPAACSTWKLGTFCSKADSAIAMSFIASLFVIMSSFSSGYSFAVLWAE